MGDGTARGARTARVTMAEVGHRARVSAQTVSRYFNDGSVSGASRARIEAAVADLDYRFNRLPRSMRAGRTDTIGFIVLGPLNYGNTAILTGISRAARVTGQTLMTTQFELDASEPSARAQVFRDLDNLLALRVDGMIVATPYVGLRPILAHVGGATPVVALSDAADVDTTRVHVDSYGAARQATGHLLALGHRRILHLAGPSGRNEAEARRRGYRDALAAARRRPLRVVECAEWDAASGAAAADAVDPASFTAVFAANDEIALGFMSRLADAGLVAPRDYSIIGIDDMPEARYFRPALSSVHLDFEGAGEAALNQVLALGRGTDTGSTTVLPSVLHSRASTARRGESDGPGPAPSADPAPRKRRRSAP